jgi:phosphatidylglycerol lysyltransferase
MTPTGAPALSSPGPAAPSGAAAAAADRKSSRYSWLHALLGAALFGVALWVLRRELYAVSYRQLTGAITAIPPSRLVWGLVLTALNYIVLTGYDQLAFVYIDRKIERGRILLAAFLAYAVANSVGFALLSGASVRYRFYSRWGLRAVELSRLVFFYSATFWLGLLVLGGASLLLSPLPGIEGLMGRAAARGLGALLILIAAVYVIAAVRRLGPLRLWSFELPLPPKHLVIAQFVLSTVDWSLAAGVLYVLLPAGQVSFPTLLGTFLAAQILGLVSQVPGGLGVFESTMLVLLRPFLPPGALLPSLVVFRVIYYLVPLAVAVATLTVDEVLQQRHHVARLSAALGALSREIIPRLLAVFTFLAGAVLLFSGATPAARGRMVWIQHLLPLAVVEASHFLGSLVGVGLLLLSNGVWRRLDAAYYLTAAALAAGIAASLLKGIDYEEALLLGVLLLAFLPSRQHFDREAAFFSARFSPGWMAAVVSVLVASVWLGLFAFQHVQYSNDLWWQFELKKEASRFLRGTVGAAMALLVFGVLRLMRPAPHEVILPGPEEMAAAERIVAGQPATIPFLVYLEDKGLIFGKDNRAFLMYAVQGKTWVALGDPVGPWDAAPDLIRAFVERCDDFDGEAVFYQVGKERLHQYADFGLTFVKLGEEARVDLSGFSLEGPSAKPFRQALRRLEQNNCTFRIAPPEEVPALIQQLRAVSDDWLAHKNAAEKGFSLGFFNPAYVARFPVGLIECNGRIEAFANIWPGAGRAELSVDLMRHRAEAFKGIMEALFVKIMQWGREQGYQWFNLGMAPLSGLEASAAVSFWTRLGRFVYTHGEAFYNFQGLRSYKEKFHPVWEPRYLAYPGGLSLPRILADVSALIAGGYRRVFLQ